MNKEEFIKYLEELNIYPTDDQLIKLDKFYHLLINWNEKINLTRITEEKDVYLKHFYDSLTITKEIDLSKVNTLCDVGTGAGFPGIVLKIMYPNLKVTLIDSLLKRVNYLNEIIKKLDLKDIEALHVRGEDLKEKYDVVTSRAVANIEITEDQLQKLNKFYELLVEWNEKINLTRITEKEDVYLKHFYDSLTITKVIDLTKVETLCDIGTGAGFPGVVLKIMYTFGLHW